MALDPQVRRLLDMVAATGPAAPVGTSVTERRSAFAKLMALSGIGVAVDCAEDRIIAVPGNPVPIRIYTPAGAGGELLPGLVFFHGGGFVAGGLDTHDSLARALANETRARLIAVDYRLAPEHRFPAALADCRAATLWTIEHAAELGIDPRRVAVCGDSAGATLAAVICQMIARSGGAGPAFQVLLCPITDFAADTESRRLFGRGHLIDEATITADLAWYLPPGIAASDPHVSPLRASDLRGLCPALIHTGEADPLRDEAQAYAARLCQAGVAVHYTCHSGMVHLFYGMAGVIPSARVALASIGAQIRGAFAERTALADRLRAG